MAIYPYYFNTKAKTSFSESVNQPQTSIELIETYFIRQQKVASFRFNPVSIMKGKIILRKRIVLEVQFEEDYSTYPDIVKLDEPFESLLKNLIINYQQACYFRQRISPQGRTFKANNSFLVGYPSYKIFIDTFIAFC